MPLDGDVNCYVVLCLGSLHLLDMMEPNDM